MILSLRQNEIGSRVFSRLAFVAMGSVVLGQVACSDSTAPIGSVQIVPESQSVALQPTAQGFLLNTSVTITNTSSQTVAYSSCGVSLEKRGYPELPPGHSGWDVVWSQICAVMDIGTAAIASANPNLALGQIILQPGASAKITISAMTGQTPFDTFSGEPGLYRVRVPLAVEFLGKFYTASPEGSVSEPFEVVPPA